MREVGSALGANEDAAKKRVNRAVEKLRGFFTKRSIVFPTAVLTAAISANSVQAAPAVLAKTATAVALAKGTAASGSTLTLIKGALKIMAWTKAKTAIVVGVGVFLAAGTATMILMKSRSGQGPSGVMQIRDQVNSMRAVNPAVEEFARAHQDELPKTLTELKPYLPPNLAAMDDQHWEISITGKMTPLIRRRDLNTIVLLQQKNVSPDKARIRVYADGSITYKK